MTSSVSVINIAAKIMKIHPRSVILISLSQLLSFSVDVVDIVLPVKDCVQDKRVFGETFNTEHYEDIQGCHGLLVLFEYILQNTSTCSILQK